MAREVQMKEWSPLQGDGWDAAVAGNSALKEAFVRALQDESHTGLSIAHGRGLLDVEAFCDGIEWGPLARCAVRK
eukprot:5795424-Pyramimonas_sp.AAC.1